METRFIRNFTETTALLAADATKWAGLRSLPIFRLITQSGIGVSGDLSAAAAKRAALHAMKTVPAYRQLASKPPRGLAPAEWLRQLPVTDKASYIKVFSTADRCVDGRIPLVGTEMDESSGSSGTPFNWVRGRDELEEVHRTLSHVAQLMFGSDLVTINAFSMGAWSTGTNTAAAFRRNGLVKSPGPDVEKVLDTLRFLGPDYTYVITGYPPFLRELLDAGDTQGFDWTSFRMFGAVGGEGMSEQLRERLERRFIKIYSAYGASDLDIGVATETPASITLRKAAAENPELRQALFGENSRLPMLFQYNPLDYYVETNEQNELIVTVCRLAMLSPRIRYNIHDVGGVLTYGEVSKIANDFGLSIEAEDPMFRLPFLFVAGRSDSTLSFMGANIYPEDVEQGLFENSATADEITGFCMELVESAPGFETPLIHVEMEKPTEIGLELADQVRRRLLVNSRDYRAAVSESPVASTIDVQIHAKGEGPFALNAGRVKRRYILPGSARQTLEASK